MRRGEVRLVDLDPARGDGAATLRPAVLVSNDGANAAADRLGRGAVTVVPVTSNLAKIYPFQVFLPAGNCSLARDWKAQAEQVRSIDVARVRRRLGRLPAPLLHELDEASRLHLNL